MLFVNKILPVSIEMDHRENLGICGIAPPRCVHARAIEDNDVHRGPKQRSQDSYGCASLHDAHTL